jgi:hypothetical protein
VPRRSLAGSAESILGRVIFAPDNSTDSHKVTIGIQSNYLHLQTDGEAKVGVRTSRARAQTDKPCGTLRHAKDQPKGLSIPNGEVRYSITKW